MKIALPTEYNGFVDMFRIGYSESEVQEFEDAAFLHSFNGRVSQNVFIETFVSLYSSDSKQEFETFESRKRTGSSNSEDNQVRLRHNAEQASVGRCGTGSEEVSKCHQQLCFGSLYCSPACCTMLRLLFLARASGEKLSICFCIEAGIMEKIITGILCTGCIIAAWRCHQARRLLFSAFGRACSGSSNDVRVYLRLQQICHMAAEERAATAGLHVAAVTAIACCFRSWKARKKYELIAANECSRSPWGLWGGLGASVDGGLQSLSVACLVQRAEAANRLQWACLRALEYRNAQKVKHGLHNERLKKAADCLQAMLRRQFVLKGSPTERK